MIYDSNIQKICITGGRFQTKSGRTHFWQISSKKAALAETVVRFFSSFSQSIDKNEQNRFFDLCRCSAVALNRPSKMQE